MLIPYLQTSNDNITQANADRTTAAANRQAELGSETTDDVRKQLVNLYRSITERVNAANIFFPSETITSFILRANAIADHYRQIGAASVSSSSNQNNSENNGGEGTNTNPTNPTNGDDDVIPGSGGGEVGGGDNQGGGGTNNGDDDVIPGSGGGENTGGNGTLVDDPDGD